MKYLLIILLFVSSFCYGQKDTVKPTIGKSSFSRSSSGCNGCMTLELNPPHIYNNTIIAPDSINKPSYDTTVGFIQIIDSKGLLVRGMGVKIDSIWESGTWDMVSWNINPNKCGYKWNTEQRSTIKIYFDACDCLLDVKKWYNFIPIGMAQSFTIYEDEHISISPNENYKKDEK